MKKKYLIWDLPVRIFHWSLVIVIVGAWYTSEQGSELIELHMQFGYVAIGLILFRVIWGIVGTKHARFTHFVPSPKTIINYVKNLKNGNDTPIAGHNPLGSLAVLLMLLLIALQASTGLFIDDDVFSSGPYYETISKDLEKLFNTLHHNTFDILLYVIGLHVLAIVYYWLKKKRNLVLPMITGKKDEGSVDKSDAIPHSKLAVALVVAAAVILFVYWLVVVNAPELEFYY